MNKPITEKDFEKTIDFQVYDVPEMDEDTGDCYMATKIDLPAAAKLTFELAKRMAIDFAQTTYKDHYDNLTSAAFGMTHYPEKTTEQLFELYQQQKQ